MDFFSALRPCRSSAAFRSVPDIVSDKRSDTVARKALVHGGSDGVASRAIRVIAIFEVTKGLIVLAAGFGLLSLLHRDLRHLAVALVTRLHIDPERHFAGVFMDAATRMTDARLWSLAAFALVYSAVREVEAYGLWLNRGWAKWLGAAGGAIYIPVEVFELIGRPTALKASVLVLNLGIVAYLLVCLFQSRRKTPHPSTESRGTSASREPRSKATLA